MKTTKPLGIIGKFFSASERSVLRKYSNITSREPAGIPNKSQVHLILANHAFSVQVLI